MSILLKYDTQDKIFYNRIHPVEFIPKVVQAMTLCSSPVTEYNGDVEMIGEASITLKRLLMSCAKITKSDSISKISEDEREAILPLMGKILKKDDDNRDVCDFLLKHLQKALRFNLMASSFLICSFIRILIEVDKYLLRTLPPGDTIPWNIKDRLSSQSFVNDVLIKLLEKEIESIKAIHEAHKVTWQVAIQAIALCSFQEAKSASVYLARRRTVRRMREVLSLIVSACQPTATASEGSTKAAAPESVDSTLLGLFTVAPNSNLHNPVEATLTSEDFKDFFKEFNEVQALPKIKGFFEIKSGNLTVGSGGPLNENVGVCSIRHLN